MWQGGGLNRNRSCLFEGESISKMDPVAIVGALQDFAQCKLQQGKTEEAVQMCRDALKICEDLVSEPLNVNMIAELARAKYYLYISLKDAPDASKERDQLKDDLKSLLGKLKDADGMSAETRKWLAEVS